MNSYYNEKDICLRIFVSNENQGKISHRADLQFRPLFDLKAGQQYSLKFENKKFSCTCLKDKRQFSYKDVKKAITVNIGVIIYLNNGCFIAISTEQNEKHNTALYDIITLLKRRCTFRFSSAEEVIYPENDTDARYKTDEKALAQISFTLKKTELKCMIWYDYLFDEKMIFMILPIIVILILSAILLNVWLLIVALGLSAFCLILSLHFFQSLDGYIQNHQGNLHVLMYEKLLVVRLRHTDIEIEYNSAKRSRSIFGLWRLKCGDFFTLALPKRIFAESPSFLNSLYSKIK